MTLTVTVAGAGRRLGADRADRGAGGCGGGPTLMMTLLVAPRQLECGRPRRRAPSDTQAQAAIGLGLGLRVVRRSASASGQRPWTLGGFR